MKIYLLQALVHGVSLDLNCCEVSYLQTIHSTHSQLQTTMSKNYLTVPSKSSNHPSLYCNFLWVFYATVAFKPKSNINLDACIYDYFVYVQNELVFDDNLACLLPKMWTNFLHLCKSYVISSRLRSPRRRPHPLPRPRPRASRLTPTRCLNTSATWPPRLEYCAQNCRRCSHRPDTVG